MQAGSYALNAKNLKEENKVYKYISFHLFGGGVWVSVTNVTH